MRSSEHARHEDRLLFGVIQVWTRVPCASCSFSKDTKEAACSLSLAYLQVLVFCPSSESAQAPEARRGETSIKVPSHAPVHRAPVRALPEPVQMLRHVSYLLAWPSLRALIRCFFR